MGKGVVALHVSEKLRCERCIPVINGLGRSEILLFIAVAGGERSRALWLSVLGSGLREMSHLHAFPPCSTSSIEDEGRLSHDTGLRFINGFHAGKIPTVCCSPQNNFLLSNPLSCSTFVGTCQSRSDPFRSSVDRITGCTRLRPNCSSRPPGEPSKFTVIAVRRVRTNERRTSKENSGRSRQGNEEPRTVAFLLCELDYPAAAETLCSDSSAKECLLRRTQGTYATAAAPLDVSLQGAQISKVGEEPCPSFPIRIGNNQIRPRKEERPSPLQFQVPSPDTARRRSEHANTSPLASLLYMCALPPTCSSPNLHRDLYSCSIQLQ